MIDRAMARVATRVCYLNVHTWNLARQDADFHRLLRDADVLYADGMAIVWASHILGEPLPARLSSADYVEEFAAACAAEEISVFLLGGDDGVARRAAERLTEAFPALRIAGTHTGFFAPDDPSVVECVNRTRPDILLVGMGSPRQERWSARHRARLNVPVIWSVGALFDYLADVEARAPAWMCRTGLEWAYRLAMDPRGKAGRYLLGNPLFVGSVAKERVLQTVLGRRTAEAIEMGAG